MSMKISPIASGSNGNCTYVETSSAKLLIDMGISFKEMKSRMESINRDVEDIDACFISHEHSDHIKGVGILARKLDIPIYIKRKAYEASKHFLGRMDNVQFMNGSTEINNTLISNFSKPHDAVDPVSIVVEDKDKKFGVITDTGYACENTCANFSELNSVLLESNYDPEMLSTCGYPKFLQNRISGENGHLSNEDAGLLVIQKAQKLNSVILGHLSGNSNTPELAYDTFMSIIKHRKDLEKLKVYVASRHRCTGIYDV